MLPMPVSIPCYGCCPVVPDWCLMLCHTQCNGNPAWSEQWPGVASEVSLSPPRFKCATTRMRLRASLRSVFSTLMCFLNEMCRSHHRPRNFVDSSMVEVCFESSQSEASKPVIGVQWNVRLCTCRLQTWNHSLLLMPVWHLLPAVKCLPMVSRERPRKHITGSSTKSALNMSLEIRASSLIVSPKHVTAKTPPFGTPSSG